MNEDILDYLILGGYSFEETSEEFDLPVYVIKEIYQKYENEN